MSEKDKEKIVKFFSEILEVYEFELIIDINKDRESIFKLKDMLGANLGNIEQEEFYSLVEIIARLNTYHNDYIYTPLEERQKNNEKLTKDDWELVARRYIENDTVAKVLSEINTKEYVKLISKKEKFKIQDIIKILDKYEQIYKSICQKFSKIIGKKILLEVDDKILYVYIKDEYLHLIKSGEINEKNYEKYLDECYETEEYYSYQDVYNFEIANNIVDDLNGIELFNENGKWDFYLTFEELKEIGYGYMVKDNYPLIEKYIIDDEKDFYNHFSLEQLKDFEESLHLYYETDDIDTNKWGELYSKSNIPFNHNIISLSEGMIDYNDFISGYKVASYNLLLDNVIEYFRENQIKNLMDYGSDKDEGLYKLSSMYQEIMDKLGIKYSNIYTEDGVSDGKYLTTITYENDSKIEIDTSAWNGIKVVTENVKSIYENYELLKDNDGKNEIENDISYC